MVLRTILFFGHEETRLGFAPRSQSFASVALPHLCSICSLSGLVTLRPSANPPNSKKNSRHAQYEIRGDRTDLSPLIWA